MTPTERALLGLLYTGAVLAAANILWLTVLIDYIKLVMRAK